MLDFLLSILPHTGVSSLASKPSVSPRMPFYYLRKKDFTLAFKYTQLANEFLNTGSCLRAKPDIWTALLSTTASVGGETWVSVISFTVSA